MKNKNLLKIQLLLAIVLLVTPIYIAYAGSKNQNGEHGTQGTDIINGLDGCRPNTQSGDYNVYVPSDVVDGFLDLFGIPQESWWFFHEWQGGPCCPSNTLSAEGNNYPLPNECCNVPDFLPDDL